ncbi:MAG: MFS transporter [Chloroflexaceae bacterium]|nr:MFS transporter [Chloroflexaceae bacterium]
MAHPASTQATVQPRINPWITLSLVCIAVFVGSVDLTIVSAVLPRIVTDLNVSIDSELSYASWIISGYLLTYTISMAFMGRFSDLIGRRMMYFVCLLIFLLGSAIAAIAWTLDLVILGRVVQALGAGAIVPISMALVGDLFAPEKRAPALGFVGAIETIGWMVGHLYGGVLMALFDDWRLLFWINIPAGLLALGLTWWALRDVQPRRASGTFDWPGALLLSASLIALNVGLSAGSELGLTDFYGQVQGLPPYALPLVLSSLLLFVAFIVVEQRVRDPLIDLAMFRQPMAASACLINALFGFVLALALTNVPLFVNARLGLLNPTDMTILRTAAWDSGWLLAALTLTMGLLAVPGGWLTNRLGLRPTTMIGLVLTLVGFVLLSTWQSDTSYLMMSIQLMITGIGMGLVISPVATAILQSADAERRGSASALVITLRLVGMTLGVSVLTLWGVYRQNMLRSNADAAAQAGIDYALASSDPAQFLLAVATTVIGEIFLAGAIASLLALVCAWWLRPVLDETRGEHRAT